MDAPRKTSRTELIQVTPLPQIVPSRVCLSCSVCCRFPEPDSFLRPYFTADEIRRAVAGGLDPAHFSDPKGCQISVVANPGGEGYLCPAFDQATSHCRIYEGRPLDCQIYPLAIMWSADRTEVVLGWDTKCPFLNPSIGHGPRGLAPASAPVPVPLTEVEAFANQIAKLIERDDSVEAFGHNPPLIGRFQDDVVILRPLPRLTARLRTTKVQRPSRILHQKVPLSPEGRGEGEGRRVALHPLTTADRPRLEQALASIDTPLASYAFAPHYVWLELFTYSWAELEGHFCLFAQYADGIYMPLPPLGSKTHSPQGRGEGEGMRAFSEALKHAFAFMRASNQGSAVSRVENVSEELKPFFESLAYCVRPKDPDYLYRARDLAKLAGDRYKSQRAACNRFVREHRYRYEPYQDEDRDACLALFRQWAGQKAQAGMTSVGRQMLADSAAVHREALTHHEALGLVGRVVRVDGHIHGYTFGYRRNPSVFCVLLEVTDRSLPGLAECIFRESCREAVAQGYEFVNTMDDSGLPTLARSKQAYHPVRLVPSYIASASSA